MEKNLEKRYGIWTAIAMVIGIVIGSGVFFKAGKVLTATGGDLVTGILAWFIVGAIMITCGYVFSIVAGEYEKVNGIVDYAEAALGKTYGYLVGFFMATIYYPTLTCVLAWVSAQYTSVLFGFSDPSTGVETFVLAGFYLIGAYALNSLSPKLAGYFQVSTTVIKLIPLVLVAVCGVLSGLSSGQLASNFVMEPVGELVGSPLLTSVVACSFAYEGWIIATSINAELIDAKRNLPRALIVGCIATVVVYIAYFIGIAGAMPTTELMVGGEEGVKAAFTIILGELGGNLLFVFVVISCLGTLNGLMLGCARGIYSVSVRGMGPAPKIFGQVDGSTNIPNNSAVLGLLLCSCWLVVWYGNFAGWWNGLFLDISELPIITMYGIYIPIFFFVMKKMTGLSAINRYVMPALAVLGSIFMIVACFIAHGASVYTYLVLFALIMVIGLLCKGNRS